jgi:hypothetical protein
MSVAIAQVFSSALAGHSRERPELVELALPLTARIGMLALESEAVNPRLKCNEFVL